MKKNIFIISLSFLFFLFACMGFLHIFRIHSNVSDESPYKEILGISLYTKEDLFLIKDTIGKI